MFNKRVYLLVKRILMLSECTVQQQQKIKKHKKVDFTVSA